MSRRFLVPPRLPSGATNPATGSEGDLWFNTTEDAIYVYDGAAWVRNGVPTGGTAGQIVAKIDGTNYNTGWIDNYASQLKHEVKLGEAIAKGQAVYVSSANGTNMIVSKASNASEATSSKTMGLLESGGSTNALVKVIAEGLLAGLDTSSASAGDPVWLGTSGNLIYGLSNKPVAPAHLVFIGIVTRAHANQGEIFVKVQNGFELGEIHNVRLTSPSTGQVLTYDSSLGYWKNASVSATNVYDYSALDGGDQVSRIELAEITGGWISQTADGGTP